jgi:hypothetical protein
MLSLKSEFSLVGGSGSKVPSRRRHGFDHEAGDECSGCEDQAAEGYKGMCTKVAAC